MNIVMSSRNTKGKTNSKSQPVETNLSTPVAVQQSQPVEKNTKSSKKSQQTTQQTTQPSTPTPAQTLSTNETKLNQKGGKKTSKQSEQVSTPAPAPVVVSEPVMNVVESKTKSSQRGGKKSEKVVEQTQAPAQVQAQAQAPTSNNVSSDTKQVGGSKRSSKVVAPVVEPVPPVAQVEQVGGVGGDAEEEQSSGQRYFKLMYNNEFQGRYSGKKPKQAANKAFSSIIKDMKKSGNQHGGVDESINFSIRECTRNSKHKEYKYVGVRETLKTPVKVEIKNEDGSVKPITYNFHNKIQKAPKA